MDESLSARAPSLSPWVGVYGFPFQLNNVKVWMILTFCMIVLALNACGFAGMTVLIAEIPAGQELSGPARIIYDAGRYIYAALTLLTVIVSLAPSVYFMVTIEDTAAGNDEVDWPDEVWFDFVTKFFFLVWIFGVCAALSTVFWLLVRIALPMPGLVWWGLVLMSAAVLFPIPLYSAMIAGSPWMLIHPLLLTRLIQKPMAGLALYAHSMILLAPCLLLGLWMIWSLTWWLAPILGAIWATCLLWYARALGRVGYVLAEEKRKVSRKRKRKKAKARRETTD